MKQIFIVASLFEIEKRIRITYPKINAIGRDNIN